MRRASRSRGDAPPVEVVIEDLGFLGDGIATVAGERVIVPLALPGERWRIAMEPRQGGQRRARALTRLSSAEPAAENAIERATPVCRHFGQCGGCRLQHLPRAAYVELKLRRINGALHHRGVEAGEIRPMAGSPEGSRRRLRLGFDRNGRLGFRGLRRSGIVPVEECPVAAPALVDFLAPLGRVLKGLRLEGEAVLTATAQGIDLVLRTTRPPDAAARAALLDLAEGEDLARITLDDGSGLLEPLVQRREPFIDIAGTPVALPAGAFLQATAEGEAALQAFARAHVPARGRVADLFCGLGTLGLALVAEGRRVAAYDNSGPAIGALRRAAGGTSLQAFERDLFGMPLEKRDLAKLDAVVLDPPRIGAAAQCAALAVSPVPVIVYASCDPASFARDAQTLVAGGYRLDVLLPVDQFVHSAEVELIACFRRSDEI